MPVKVAIDPADFETHGALKTAFAFALVLELGLLWVLSHGLPRTEHAPPLEVAIAPIDAQIFTKPMHETHLVEKKAVSPRTPVRAEPVISRAVDVGRAATPKDAHANDEKNQTDSARPEVLTHGPIVVASPAPKLPEYLRGQNLKTTVLLEFTVGIDGKATPHLLGSSGNDELDAIALKAAQDWKFNPAVQANQPVASKVRLRINFEVE